jgi:hypothetical protein
LALEGQEREIKSSGIDNNNTSATMVENSSKSSNNLTVEPPVNSNVILFDDNIHASREITHPSNAFLQEQQPDSSTPPYDPRQSATTIVNIPSI